MRLRPVRPDLPVAPGERLLAWSTTADGVVIGGTRDALYIPGRIGWEQVEAAHWDRDSSELRISEVARWGEARPEHRFTIEEPGRLLELLRERVTASVVITRHVAVDGRRGLRVIGRRPPASSAPITWVHEYDDGIDPSDPTVRAAAAEGLAAARVEVGET